MRIRHIVLLLVVVAVACTGGGGSASPPATDATPAPTTSATTHPVTPGTIPAFVEVELAVVAGPNGDQLVDVNGMSLYMFALDDERTSTCEGACAAAWPPLLGDPVATPGVDPGLSGNAERRDGSIQVTYGGHPLYYYSGDAAPGDVSGHGFNDVWFLVAPDGNPIG